MATQESAGRIPLPVPLPKHLGMHSCGAWWTGLRRSHCAAPGCCITFSSETAAERHRKTVDGKRVCVDPASVGLVRTEKRWGVCWTLPGPAEGLSTRWYEDEPDS